MRKPTALVVTALSGFLCAPAVFAAPSNLDVTVGTDLEYHDNAALVHTDEQSDLDRIAYARLGFDRKADSLPVKIDYLVERHDYQDDVEEDYTAISGATRVDWIALPHLLDFNFTHQISEQQQDRRGPDVASNRERRSILSAGANGYGHLGSVDTLILSPRFTDVQLQDSSGADSQYASVTLAWQHRLSAVSALSLSGTRDSVNSDDSQNDYDASRVMLDYDSALSHLKYRVGVGYNRIERDQHSDENGYSAVISADYDQTYYSWGVAAVRQLTDSSIGLSGFENSLNDFKASDGNVDQFDIVESSQVDIHGQRQLGTGAVLSGRLGYIKLDYQDTPRDENTYFAEVGYAYTMNTRWTLGTDVRFERSDFPDDPANLEQDDKWATLYARYRHTERLSARFSLGREQRDANVSASDYTDNFATVGISYLIY